MKIGIAIFAVVVCLASGAVLSICLDEKGQTSARGEKPASEGSVVPDRPDSDDIPTPQAPRSPKRDSLLYFRAIVVVRQNLVIPTLLATDETERRHES